MTATLQPASCQPPTAPRVGIPSLQQLRTLLHRAASSRAAHAVARIIMGAIASAAAIAAITAAMIMGECNGTFWVPLLIMVTATPVAIVLGVKAIEGFDEKGGDA